MMNALMNTTRHLLTAARTTPNETLTRSLHRICQQRGLYHNNWSVTLGKVICNNRCDLSVTPVRHAGHSKWQNIRHIKAAKDSQKQKIANAIVLKMRIAAKEGGNVNPKLNSKLAKVLEEAKLKGVPNSTVEATLKRMEKSASTGTQGYLEGKTGHNCLLMLEIFSDKHQRTWQTVQNIFKRFGGSLGNKGSCSYAYNFKGVVYVPVTEENPMSLDDATELAIETGAEEVEETVDEDSNKMLKFLCDPKELQLVKKSMDEKNIVMQDAKLEYIPHTFVSLNEEQQKELSRMFDLLEEHEDVVQIYDNIKMS